MDFDSIKSQYQSLPLLLSTPSCRGKTYIITGSNIGLGLECARHLVDLGASKVILAVRSLAKGQDALAAIEESTGRKGVVEVWHLNMSSYDSITMFCGRVSRELDRGVDAVVANAAAANGTWSVTDDGWESTIGVNFVGTMLLVVLLLPVLKEMGRKVGVIPRLVVVSSALAWVEKGTLVKMEMKKGMLADLNDEKRWGIEGSGRYALSKLLQIFALRRFVELAPLSSTGVIINMINPGLCKTGLVRYATFTTKILVGTLRAVMGQSAEWGSRCLIHGIAAGEESHGQFLSYCRMRDTDVPDWVKNDTGKKWGELIWTELAAELEKAVPGCTTKVIKS